MHPRIAALVLSTVLVAACHSGGGSPPAGPTLTSVTPATGTVGTVVTIAGTGFAQGGYGSSAVNPTVTFTPVAGGAGVAATVKSFSATSLDVSVPQVASAAAGSAYKITVANPGGGSGSLASAFTMAAPVITDVNGGLNGSGTVNSLFILDGKNFGDLSASPASGYSVDFRDATSNAVVATATVNFANSDWQDIFIVSSVPAGLLASTTYRLTVTTPSGTSAPSNFLVTGAVSLSPSTIGWTSASSLPAPLQGLGATVVPMSANTFVYAIGGNSASTSTASGKSKNVKTVSFNSFVPASGLLANASWTATTPLPAERGFVAAVSANSFNSVVSGNGALYAIGGLDATGAAMSTVYTASLNADGTVPAATAATGSWVATTALPQALFGASAVIFHGRIYVAGGNDSTGAPSAKVYSSKINADGTLAPWQTLPDLPAAVAYHQLATAGGALYVVGGTNASGQDPVTNVQSSASSGAIYYAPINIRNGALASTSWTTNASALGKAREKHSAVVAGGYLLLSGGLYSGSPGSSEESYASINADATVSSFNGATGSHTIAGSSGGYNFYNHAGLLFVDTAGNPHVVIVGGADAVAGTPVGGVWVQH